MGTSQEAGRRKEGGASSYYLLNPLTSQEAARRKEGGASSYLLLLPPQSSDQLGGRKEEGRRRLLLPPHALFLRTPQGIRADSLRRKRGNPSILELHGINESKKKRICKIFETV